MWSLEQLEVEGDAFRAEVSNGANAVEFMAALAFVGRREARMSGLHIDGSGPHTLGRQHCSTSFAG